VFLFCSVFQFHWVTWQWCIHSWS